MSQGSHCWVIKAISMKVFITEIFLTQKNSNNLNVEQLGNGFKKPVDSNAVIKNNNF